MESKKTYSISLFLLPMVSCLVMTVYLVIAYFQTRPQYGKKCIAAALLVLFVWLLLVAVSQKTKKGTVRIPLIPFFITVVLLSFYACHTVWGSGYLTLAPYESLGFGAQHKDTMFHSAIAESFKRSFIPSNLLNDEIRIYYHTFSHLLMAGISGLLNMPAFIAYNFLYPVVFVPVYLFAQLYAVIAAKKYFSGKPDLRLFDLIYLLLFNCGIMYTDLLGYNGAGKKAFFISESFLISNTILLFLLALCFHMLAIREKQHKKIRLYVWIVIPVGLFLMSWAKLSVGIMFVAGFGFYVIRTHFRNIRAWLLLMLYGLVIVSCFWFFKGFNILNVLNPFKGSSGPDQLSIANNQTVFLPLSFELYCGGKLGIWGHVLFMSAPVFLFAFCEFSKGSCHAAAGEAAEKSRVWIETGIVCLAVGLLPVLLLHIAGGSAGYFSSVVPLVMMVLICGHQYFALDEDCSVSLKRNISLVCFSLAAATAFFNIPANSPLEYVTGENGSGIAEHVSEIRSLTQGHPDDYTVYLDSDAYVARLFRNSNSSVFVYPALTGVGVINASYQGEDGLYYAYCDVETVNYGTTGIQHGRLDLEQALERAKKNGKKYVIHVKKNTYQVIDLGTGEMISSRKIREKTRFLRINNYEQFLFNTRAVLKKESRMVGLLSQGAAQSPVYNFKQGSYYVVFLGNNLNLCEYSVFDNPVIPEGMTIEEAERSADKVIYRVQVDREMSVDIQFEIKNTAASGIAMIRQIVLEKITGK